MWVQNDVDILLVISENEMRKEFLNVNANKAKVPNGLTGKIKKKHMCIPTVSYLF